MLWILFKCVCQLWVTVVPDNVLLFFKWLYTIKCFYQACINLCFVLSGVDKNKKFALLSAPFAGKGKKVKVREKKKGGNKEEKRKVVDVLESHSMLENDHDEGEG